jgi:hypothetical protein
MKFNVVCWQLDILGRRLSGVKRKWPYWIELCIGLHCDWWMLTGLERQKWRDYCGYEQRLTWCWTEKAAPWMSQQLGLLLFHIACMVWGIELCWCWQCLLTVGGNLLPHIVTAWDVTSVAWCYRQTQDVLHSAECHTATLLNIRMTVDSKWLHCVIVQRKLLQSLLEVWCLQHYLTACLDCWTGASDKCVRWYCASC